MDYYLFPIYLFFGLVPSLIWLWYYLQKDLHPEPKRMILKIFLLGVVVAIPVFLIEKGLSFALVQLHQDGIFDQWPIWESILQWFVVIGFTEEFLKYVVVRLNVIGNAVLDEPLDIMLYMVVVALGFAAAENTLYVLSPILNSPLPVIIQTTLGISFIRFIGGTFLHTLCSALVGYFLAMASLKSKKGVLLPLTGIVLAALMHGLYDFSIVILPSPINFIVPTTIILLLFLFVIYDFDGIKKIKGICKLN